MRSAAAQRAHRRDPQRTGPLRHAGLDASGRPASPLEGIFREVSVRYITFIEGDGRLLDRDGLKHLDEAGALPGSLARDEGFMRYLDESRSAAKLQEQESCATAVAVFHRISATTMTTINAAP